MNVRAKKFKWDIMKYGLTVEQYESQNKKQQGKCSICRRIPISRLVIDHDHETGKIRGLLCGTCNVGLGMFCDDPSVIRKAALYLEQTR